MATAAELRAAYDDLIAGKAVARLRDENGEELTYARADLDKLLRRIKELEDIESPIPSGPLRVYF